MKPSIRVRRLYADLIEGRSRVRVAQPDMSLAREPAFLVGPYRSGTTLLRLVLDSHSQLACPPETTFHRYLEPMTNDVASGFEYLGFDSDHVAAKAREFADYFYNSYAASNSKQRWIDKSPEYVWSLAWLQRLYPDARFVILTRNPLDQIDSHLRSGHALESRLGSVVEGLDPNALEVGCAKYWRQATERQIAMCEDDSASTFIVSYDEFCERPEAVGRGMFEFLGLPWEPEVLRFHAFSHDFGASDTRARVSRSISAGTGHATQWSQAVEEECREITREAAERISTLRQQQPTFPAGS